MRRRLGGWGVSAALCAVAIVPLLPALNAPGGTHSGSGYVGCLLLGIGLSAAFYFVANIEISFRMRRRTWTEWSAIVVPQRTTNAGTLMGGPPDLTGYPMLALLDPTKREMYFYSLVWTPNGRSRFAREPLETVWACGAAGRRCVLADAGGGSPILGRRQWFNRARTFERVVKTLGLTAEDWTAR
jgi:hypothetical protein